MKSIIAIVGMPGSGKSEAARILKDKNYFVIRFGDVTDEYLKKGKMRINEKNERKIREWLRKKYGMNAYAKLNIKKINKALKNFNVVIDGLYSFEEYAYLKKKYKNRIFVLAIHAKPETRYERLGKRKIRPLTVKECVPRDYAQLKNLNTGGPIAMADFVIVNEISLKNLERNVENLLRRIGSQANQTNKSL